MPVPLTHITSADHSAPGSSYTPSAAGPVNIRITVQGHRSSDLTRDLFSWLAHDPSLRGLLSIVDGEPPAFALGCADTALVAVLGPGGAVTALATIAITWLRHHTSKVTISISASEDECHSYCIDGVLVEKLDAQGLHDLIEQLSSALSSEQPSESAGQDHGDHSAIS